MVQAITPKHKTAVQGIMKRFGRSPYIKGKHLPLRQVISLRSENNLAFLAGIRPTETRAILKNVLSLKQRGEGPFELKVPDGLYMRANRDLLKCLAYDFDYFAGLIDKKTWTLDIGKASPKSVKFHTLKKSYIDITPHIKKPSLDSAIEILKNAQEELISREELANLVLFRVILAARIRLYALGEAKSAAKKAGDKDGYAKRMGEMKELAAQLFKVIDLFPFVEREGHPHIAWKETLGKAALQIQKGNNPSADMALIVLGDKLEGKIEERDRENALAYLGGEVLKRLEEQEDNRIEASKERKRNRGMEFRGGKVRIVNDLYGECVINSQGYIKLAEDVVHKSMIGHNVSTKKILSMIQHEIESVEAENKKNEGYIIGLEIIQRSPESWRHKLYELCVLLSRMRDLGKQKALAEVWGALELASIYDEKGQALKLSSSLIGMAIKDLKHRNEVLEVQLQSLKSLKDYTEKLIGQLVMDLGQRWAEYFARKPKLTAARLKKVKAKLGKYLGTLLGPKKEDLREKWMRQARGHITAVLAMASKLYKLKSRLEQLREKRTDPMALWNCVDKEVQRIWNSNSTSFKQRKKAVKAMKGMAERQLRGIEKETAEIEKELMEERNQDTAIKSARLMLQIEFDFVNRGKKFKKGERKKALRKFFNKKIGEFGPEIARY